LVNAAADEHGMVVSELGSTRSGPTPDAEVTNFLTRLCGLRTRATDGREFAGSRPSKRRLIFAQEPQVVTDVRL
jgi:hypothetical protein